jgi:glutamyl-tRNA synthetase
MLADLESFDEDALETALRGLAEELGLKAGQLFGIIRVAITGKAIAPPLFGTLAVLGRERSLARMELAEAKLSGLE